jgi:hypothetical protein
MIGDNLGNGIIEGANIRPISLEKRQAILQARFAETSRELEAFGTQTDEANAFIRDMYSYDDLEDWFETQCASFKAAKLPIPERPGIMREDSWDLERLVALADQLGSKLQPDDVTPGMRRFATEWLRSLPTPISFDYLRDMRSKLETGTKLTIPMAKGVLNCAIQQARRTPKASAKTPVAEPIELDAGIYFKGGVVYKVQKAVHGSGHSYAKRLVPPGDRTDGARDPVMGLQGHTRARFEYDKGAIRSLTADDLMTLEQAKEYGAIYGVCCNCGATLTDETSIELGIGPVCRSKFVR